MWVLYYREICLANKSDGWNLLSAPRGKPGDNQDRQLESNLRGTHPGNREIVAIRVIWIKENQSCTLVPYK